MTTDKDKTIRVGEFNLSAGVMRVSDPCYAPDTWCAGTFPARPGKWRAEIETSDEGAWGTRVASLTVRHESVDDSASPEQRSEVDVGVDSGQAGFFDDARYADVPGRPDDDSAPNPRGLYWEACRCTGYDHRDNHTLPRLAGILRDIGAVSSSGYGDGGYPLRLLMIDGVAVAARVIFIGEKEEEDEDADQMAA